MEFLPIWWKDKSRLMKQLFGIIFDFKIKISGKNCVEKHPHIIVFMFGSKTNAFGQVWMEQFEIWRKSSKTQEVLEFFPKTFGFSDLFCQTGVHVIEVTPTQGVYLMVMTGRVHPRSPCWTIQLPRNMQWKLWNCSQPKGKTFFMNHSFRRWRCVGKRMHIV